MGHIGLKDSWEVIGEGTVLNISSKRHNVEWTVKRAQVHRPWSFKEWSKYRCTHGKERQKKISGHQSQEFQLPLPDWKIKNIVCGLSNLNITYRFLQNFDPVEILILFDALGALKKNIKE